MSSFLFLASDEALTIVENPYIKKLSLHEALALDMELPDFLLENQEIDPNEPIIQICESDELLGELEIAPALDCEDLVRPYTGRKLIYGVSLRYTQARGGALLDYLQAELERVLVIELYSIWLGDDQSPACREVFSQNLSEHHLRFLDQTQGFQGSRGLILHARPRE